MALKKIVYGLDDAGRAWYLKLKDILLETGNKDVKDRPYILIF